MTFSSAYVKTPGISKRGNFYVRYLLINGARSAIRGAIKKNDQKSNWIKIIQTKRGANIAALALANKTVRTIWSMLVKNTNYDLNYKSTTA